MNRVKIAVATTISRGARLRGCVRRWSTGTIARRRGEDDLSQHLFCWHLLEHQGRDHDHQGGPWRRRRRDQGELNHELQPTGNAPNDFTCKQAGPRAEDWP